MSPKELLYVEDALGHAQDLQTAFSDLALQIQDTELKSFVNSLANKQNACFDRFFSLL